MVYILSAKASRRTDLVNDIVLDAGAHVNGYPRFLFDGEAGAEITITYLERFGDGMDGQPIDDLNGSVSGRADHIVLNGSPIRYEPFWVRTFRSAIYVHTYAGRDPAGKRCHRNPAAFAGFSRPFRFGCNASGKCPICVQADG